MVEDAVDPKKLKAFQLSEKEFQDQVTELAETLGWWWYHPETAGAQTRASRTWCS